MYFVHIVFCTQSTNNATVEPLNKGHFGDNINSAVLSFIERLSSFRGSNCTKTIGHVIFGTSNSVLCREAHCPYFGGSTIGGSTVFYTLHDCMSATSGHVHLGGQRCSSSTDTENFWSTTLRSHS